MTVMCVLLFVLHVCLMRECDGARLTARLVWGMDECVETHNTHRHNTTTPSQTLAKAAHTLSPNTTHTTAIKTQTPLFPCSSRIGKAQTQSCHPLTHSPQQPHPQHRVQRQPHRQTKDYHRTTNTTQAHRPSSKCERNLIILQVNINGHKNKLEELKRLIHDIYADIITIQETKLTPKVDR